MTSGVELNPIYNDYTQQAATAAQQTDGEFAEAFENANERLSTKSATLDDIFERAAAEYNLPVSLLKAVAKVESGFNTNAVSGSGAMGVMQLMPKTAAYLGVSDAFDAEQNIMGGAKYIRENLDRFGGDVDLALAAYNCGYNNVQKHGNTVPSFAQGYVSKVNAALGGSLDIPASANLVTGSSRKGKSSGGVYTVSSGTGSDIPLAVLSALFDKMTKEKDDDDKVPM